MRAVDEKLTINKLGPYVVLLGIQIIKQLTIVLYLAKMHSNKESLPALEGSHFYCELVSGSPKLDERGPSQQRAHGPLGYLTAVVLQLCGKHSSLL